MTSLNMTSADAALKQLYKSKNFATNTYDRRPLLGLLPKEEDFFGRNMPLIDRYGNPQGVSADFAVAQAVTTAAKIEDFLLTRVNEHSVATIDGETLDAMSNDAGAFLSAMEAQVEGAKMALADRLESMIPRSQTGAIGKISSGSTVTAQTITLDNINDVVNFEVGMTLVASTADGGALRTGSATGEVLAKVNRRTGVLTATSAQWDTVITAIAATDFLYPKGDAKANSTAVVMAGFASWFPSTAPSGGESFFGVDRSVDTRLYGQALDASAYGYIEEALIDASSISAREGGKPDTCFINHVDMRKLTKEIGSKTQYAKPTAKSASGAVASVGYKSVVVDGAAGPVDIVAANKIPSGTAYMLECDCCMLATIGNATKFNTQDGNRILRQASADGVEVRLVFRGNFGCRRPGFSVNITLPS